MNRPWQIWSAFVACLAVVTAAVGWVSVKALDADRAEAAAHRQAALEENARLALWRMDSFMAPLVAQESARPYFMYASFYSTERSNSKAVKGKAAIDATCPSPLLTQSTPFVRLHFQCEMPDKLTSPEVPQGATVSKAVPEYLSSEQLRTNVSCLSDLQKTVNAAKLLDELPPPVAATISPAMAIVNNGITSFGNTSLTNSGQFGGGNNRFTNSDINLPNAANQPAMMNGPPPPTQPNDNGEGNAFQQALAQPAIQQQTPAYQPLASSYEQQGARNQIDFQARQRSVAANTSVSQSAGLNYDNNLNPGEPSEVQMSMMTPLWLDGQLVLARRVQVGAREFVQGCLLDWAGDDGLRHQLLGDIADLLPSADLKPVLQPTDSSEVRRLASIPAMLIPGALQELADTSISPITLSLLLAWGAMGLAAVAVAVLLRGVVALSERRAAFVSAVTHELRTPLTTFRMYAEMLSEGMVQQESDRRSYLETLRIEADRLTHLVGNVLAYARLERGKPGGRIETVTVGELLDVATQRLADRAQQANLELSMEPSDGVMHRQVKADPAAVEQILFNLVDNACKYAAMASDRRLHLSVAADHRYVQIRLRDHGPGIPSCESRRLFQAFHKTAQEAAVSAPGVGLGLALSRRLAHDMHGQLVFEPAPDGKGACFTLSLPTA